MRQSVICVSLSALMIGSGLSGCASLKKSWGSFKTGSVTMPGDMSKAAYVADDLAPALEFQPAAQIEESWTQPTPVEVTLYNQGPSLSGFQAVSYANRTAAVKPTTDNYVNAIQQYPYVQGSLYQVYTSPSQVTDIALQKGEGLITVSAGDTDHWTVGDTVSGSGASEQVHILVKPNEANLSTNAIITSTKRTYYLDLKSFADTYMAAVSWRYPRELIRRFVGPQKSGEDIHMASVRTADLIPEPEDMHFDYRIAGDSPAWRPVRVFDDGRKVFIEFPDGLAVSEAPPLFITDGNDGKSRLVNYRVKDDFYVVDRLFDAAELRLGEKSQTVVRIERQS